MNDENLKKGALTQFRSGEEAARNGQKGGKASGESRRRKANFKKTLNTLLTTEIENPEWTPVLEALGLECTLESALNMAMIKEGLSGNVKAYEAVAKYSGQSAQTDFDEEEQQIKIDRAKQARDREVGSTDSSEENIQNFLRAIRPTEQDLNDLFAEDEDIGEETKTTSEV